MPVRDVDGAGENGGDESRVSQGSLAPAPGSEDGSSSGPRSETHCGNHMAANSITSSMQKNKTFLESIRAGPSPDSRN